MSTKEIIKKLEAYKESVSLDFNFVEVRDIIESIDFMEDECEVSTL